MFGIGEIASAISSLYIFRMIYALVEPNFGLIVVLIAFISGGLVIRAALSNQYPGTDSLKKKAVVYFVIPGFFFIIGFTVFHEKRKLDALAGLKPPVIASLNRLG